MRLDAVYELRDRLETAAIAGVNLIPEDFRLKRAVQQLEPYAKASPVFQKIYAMALKLTAAECGDRAGVLFDTLGLVDAVLCTQGTLQTEGDFCPLDTENNQGDLYQQIPYSRMAPVLEAFRGTGGGRYAVIRDAHEADPEIFQDYRMKYWMVQALGDSYSELADMVAEWLEEEGTAILPLLKRDFRPDGKKDMVRRLQVMEAVAKGDENDFYRSLLPEAEKEVREEAIRALRFEQDNLPLLLDLAKSEKGKAKDAVLYALSFMDGAEAEAFWKNMMEKKTEAACSYLVNSRKEWAGDLIADAVERWLVQYSGETKSQEAMQLLENIWDAALGKCSDRLLACYDKVYLFLPEHVSEILTNSLIREPYPALCREAEELYRKHGDECLEPAFIAALMTEPAEQVFARFSNYLKPAGIVAKMKGKIPDGTKLIPVISKIYYSEERGCYCITEGSTHSPVMMSGRPWRRLPYGFDLKWYPLLMNYEKRGDKMWRSAYSSYGNYYDAMLAALYRPDVEELSRQYGEYFYKAVQWRMATTADIRMLKRCGWTDYRGILAAYRRGSNVPVYRVRELLSEIPMTNSELADELDELIRKLNGKAVNGFALLEHWRDSLRSGVTADRL